MLKSIKTAYQNTVDRLVAPERLVVAGQTPFANVYSNEHVKVRCYSLDSAKKRYPIPLVIVPPMAVNTLIYDWFPDRSLVKYLVESGFDVYMLDWGSPDRKQAHFNLVKYVGELMPAALAAVRAHSGQQKLSLHGWSMGGGFVLTYRILSGDQNIKNMVILGTAIDARKNGEVGRFYARLNKRLKAVGIKAHKIPARLLYSPAWLNAIGFKVIDPVSSMQGYLDLAKNLHDRDFVVRHTTMSAFLDNLEAYPGGVIRDWTATLWLNNDPGERGYFRVGKRKLHLSDVDCSLLMVVGKKDLLAQPACCTPLFDWVTSQDKTLISVAEGHTGIVSGSRAPDQVWPQVVDWLSKRSG